MGKSWGGVENLEFQEPRKKNMAGFKKTELLRLKSAIAAKKVEAHAQGDALQEKRNANLSTRCSQSKTDSRRGLQRLLLEARNRKDQ